MTTAVKAIAEAANTQVVQLATQVTTNASEINRALGDCCTFVEQTRVDSEASKLKLTQEVDALQTRFQKVVQFVDGMPDTVTALQEKLNAVTGWCAANSLDTGPVVVIRHQEKYYALMAQVDLRMTQLNNNISVTRSAVGANTGSHGSPWVEKDLTSLTSWTTS